MIKMKKNEIAEKINDNIQDISRMIKVDYLLEIEIDSVFETEKAESWTDGGEFKVENDAEYTYVFRAVNAVPVHVVDYDNEEETDELGATDCEYEREVLVPAGTKFKILSAGTLADMEEMGYITVYVEYIK
jgi:hypothetical protein